MYANRAVSSRVDSPLHASPLALARTGDGGPQLIEAVRGQDRNAVRQLLQTHPASVHYQDTQGNTALHVAIATDAEPDIVDLLLASRADPGIVNEAGNTCLHLAFGLRPAVPSLPTKLMEGRWCGTGLGIGAIGRPNAAGKNAMAMARDDSGAIVPGYEAAVRNAEQILLTWMDGAIASLRAAVAADDPVAVRGLIVRTGWSLAAPLAEFGNAVHYALTSGARGAVFELARIAAEQGRADVLDALDVSGLLTPLGIVALTADIELIKALLNAGASVDQRNATGFTPLHLAAGGGKMASVKLLLARGANPESRADDGITPIMLAAEGGHGDIIKELQLAGGNVNGRDANGITPMMYAYLGGHTLTALRIGALGGRPEAVDNDGKAMKDYVAMGRALREQAGQSTCVLL